MLQKLQSFASQAFGLAPKPFQYLPFIQGLDEIRLLKLTSWHSGTLINVPRNAAPSYFALSYAWGDPTPSQRFQVNTQPIKIPTSLSQALKRVYVHTRRNSDRGGGDVYVWADAICINQIDNEEKASQVVKMNHIYRQAAGVIVYLGEDQYRLFDGDGSALVIRGISEMLERGASDPVGDPDLLRRLFRRPWWNRVWTLQEVVSTPQEKTVVLSGEGQVDWSVLAKAVQVWLDRETISTRGGVALDDLISEVLLGGLAAKTALGSAVGPDTKHDWVGVLAATANFASSDPRDRIYALIAMCHSLPGFEISYTKPVPEVYTDFCMALTRRYKSLEFLQLAGVNHGPSDNPHQLPSWVPNFENLDHPILPYRNLLATKHAAQHVQNSFKVWSASPYRGFLAPPTAHSKLRPRGILMGTISAVVPPQKDIARDGDPDWLLTALRQFGFRYNAPTLRCHILQAYFRTLLGDYYPYTNQKLHSYPGRFELAGAFWAMARESLAHFLQIMNLKQSVSELLLGEVAPEGALSVEVGRQDHAIFLWRVMTDKFQSLHFFTTSNGYMGYGPQCQPGDVVSVIFGCSVPLLMRPTEKGYVILGQCFVLGVMNGDLFRSRAWRRSRGRSTRIFDII